MAITHRKLGRTREPHDAVLACDQREFGLEHVTHVLTPYGGPNPRLLWRVSEVSACF